MRSGRAVRPELGARSVVDRLAQLEPSVLLAVGRLRLPRPLDRPPRRGGHHPGCPPHPAARRARALRRARLAGRRWLGRAPRRPRRATRLRARRLRPPAVRAVLVGDDRPTEGNRARARRHPAGAAQGTCVQLGPEAGRPPALVLDDVMDDVERARGGAPRALVDRHARRRPDLAGCRLAVARGRGDEAELHGREPGVPDGLPQSRPAPRARLRARLDSRVRHRRLAASGGGLPLCLRRARTGRAADQRERRDRRLQRDRRRFPASARLRRRDLRAPARRGHGGVRPGGATARR